MKKPTISIIVSTYNWPKALKLVLKSLLGQTVLPNEVLIADDGSKKDTQELIKTISKNTNVKITHVWHEDNGFRKAIILNKAYVKASGEYVIQLDGDCIAHKNLVADHLKFLKKGQFLHGPRVNIRKEYLNHIFDNELISFNPFSKEIKNRSRALYFPFFNLFKSSKKTFSNKFRGCNFSLWKKDFIDVNGYNEDFTGWGKEDSDLAIRLLNNGVKSKRIRNGIITFHLWHKSNSRDNLNTNESIQSQSINENATVVKNGIIKHT